MSKLIVSGCSYTDNWYTSRFGFTTWPELLAEKLGMECINLGSCGSGNEYILSSLMDMMFKKEIGLMIAMWSELQRIDFEITISRQDSYKPDLAQPFLPIGKKFTRIQRMVATSVLPAIHRWTHVNMRQNADSAPWRDEAKEIFQKENVGTLPAMICKGIRAFYTFQTMMEVHNIPYLQIQGCSPCHYQDEYIFMKQFFLNQYFLKMNENTFVGWPILSALGGTHIDQVLDDIDPDRKKLRISEEDTHPNKEGHEAICDFLLERVKCRN